MAGVVKVHRKHYKLIVHVYLLFEVPHHGLLETIPYPRHPVKTFPPLPAEDLCRLSRGSVPVARKPPARPIAGQLACFTGVGFSAAWSRLYRFLRNERFDNWRLARQRLRLLGPRDQVASAGERSYWCASAWCQRRVSARRLDQLHQSPSHPPTQSPAGSPHRRACPSVDQTIVA